MRSHRIIPLAAFLLPLLPALPSQAQQPANPPLPEIRQFMREVYEHQKQLDKLRENYTYSSLQTVQEIDANGRVTKTEIKEYEEFFVNGHHIARLVKKDGKPLDDQDQQRETERVTRFVERAEKPETKKAKENEEITLRRVLEIMDVRNPRRESYRGRPTIIFDFVGHKDAKAHGMAEDISKKLQGTVWIDEADRQVAHLEISFNDTFRLAGGLVVNIQKGSNLHFDQAPVNSEIWLPTGVEGTFAVRLFMVKGIRQHIIERDFDYKRFHVETQQGKDAKVKAAK
jgi:hypothetical protein